MAKILYLLPDTNFFIQCKVSQELDWAKWKEFSEVHLIVCQPVQREIDEQKTRGGNTRVGKRARKTYSKLFRPIAIGEKQFQLIRQADPAVRLFLEAPSWPDQELTGKLDYSKSDNEIVGCLSRYVKENLGVDARLLSNDAGPLMTARSMGLSVEPIAPEWLLPPEHSSAEREIDHLSKEIAQLKKREPQFRIRCTDHDDNEVAEINLVHNKYEPLTDEDVSSCIEILENRFPIVTEFNQRTPKPARSIASALLGDLWRFDAASEDDIVKYREADYPARLKKCRRELLSIHEALQKREGLPSFAFAIENVGSRPAVDALVVFKSKGNFRICPPPFEEEDTDDSEQTETRLPRPPKPPRGIWESTLSPFNELMRSTRIGGLLGSEFPSMKAIPFATDRPPRDPNAFYYKQRRQTEPSDSFSLECEQWRHGTGWEVFHGDIFPREGVGDSTGVLEYEIHAGNLSKPILRRIRVKVSVREVSSRDFANRLVNPPPKELFRS